MRSRAEMAIRIDPKNRRCARLDKGLPVCEV